MPNWINITASDLNDYLVAAQVTALRSAALDSGQTDPFNRIAPDIIARIRAEVRGCVKNQVDADPLKIPQDLKSIACILILESLQGRIPSLKLTEDQKKAADNARRYLERISRCEVPIARPENPESPDQVQKSGPVQIVNSRTRKFTGKTMEGL